MTKQVLVCDQQHLYALGSSAIIQEQAYNAFCFMIQDLSTIASRTTQHPNSLIIIDSNLLHFEQPNTSTHIKTLKKTHPLMVVFNEEDDLHLFNIIENGISVVVTRNVTKEEYIKAIEMAIQERTFFCSNIESRVYNLVNLSNSLKQTEMVNDLDKFDQYILLRICEEVSSKEIAIELGCSTRTIEGHRTRLMQKLGVKNVAGLVKITVSTKLYENYLSNPGRYAFTA